MHEFGVATGIALLVSLVSFSGSVSAPVTPEDLTGKTICWQNSQFGDCTASFSENGKYSNSESNLCGPVGEGTWAITPNGVKIDTDARHYVDKMEKLPDGTFLSDVKIASAQIKSTGKTCK